ncbi:MAG: lysophospholipid acyltransferase family protein [Myxococcota bacterium]
MHTSAVITTDTGAGERMDMAAAGGERMGGRSVLGKDPFARRARETTQVAPARKARGAPSSPSPEAAPPQTALQPFVDEVVGELADVAPVETAAPTSAPAEAPPAEPRMGLRDLYSRLRRAGDPVAIPPLDGTVRRRAAPVLDFLRERYWRIRVQGVEHVPAAGRAMLVSNHGGLLPYDAVMLMHVIAREHAHGRLVRPLVEDAFMRATGLGGLLRGLGAVHADADTAERMLNAGEALTVFPEGMQGLTKLYRDRYRLQRFGRGGFVRMALRTGTPIIPVAIVGAEELHPMLGRLGGAARAGFPRLPVTATFPWLGLLGLVPLPTRWSIHVGAPLFRDVPRRAYQDDATVMRLTDEVRTRIQRMLDDAVASRHSVVRG